MATTFTNTAAALVEYDTGAAARSAAWDAIESNADCDACVAADKAALEVVQRAFHKDTADFNSLHDCLLVDLGFMRRMARGG